MRRPEFLKAVRALSARYVERRAVLGEREPTDSAGKRAAFAGFFASLHFLTTEAIVREIGACERPLGRIVDLGCGTGVASAAWALGFSRPPVIAGTDRQAWMLQEAAWNWRQLGLAGRTRRGDMVAAAERLAEKRAGRDPLGVVLGWSVNELDTRGRERLLPALRALATRGASILILEPLARTAVPWWDDWAAAAAAFGGRAAEWKLDRALPSELAALDEAAGFKRDALSARTLWIAPRSRVICPSGDAVE